MKYAVVILGLTLSWFSAIAQSTPDLGPVASELVGRWCYISPGNSTLESMSNSCITLNADGTYEIHLDAGTMGKVNASFPGMSETDYGNWGVKDGRVYYKSSVHGEGSLRLQKVNHPRIESTPTIVLDGIVFCSAIPRDPW